MRYVSISKTRALDSVPLEKQDARVAPKSPTCLEAAPPMRGSQGTISAFPPTARPALVNPPRPCPTLGWAAVIHSIHLFLPRSLQVGSDTPGHKTPSGGVGEKSGGGGGEMHPREERRVGREKPRLTSSDSGLDALDALARCRVGLTQASKAIKRRLLSSFCE